MALQAQQICNLARQDAKCPNYTSQSGQLLNVILQELCQTYQLDVNRGTTTFNFNPGSATNPTLYPNIQPGGGPYALPTDFLRMWDDKDNTWFLNGVPYPMIPCDISEYDNFVQQSNMQAYPYIAATDVSAQAVTTLGAPQLLIWPPASGAFLCMTRYVRQMADISTPESSSTIPWFPNSQYLRTRLAGELMKITDDDRWKGFLDDSPSGAQGILDRYLKLQGDNADRATTVKLDRRSFRQYTKLPNTKTIGWVTTLALTSGWMVDAALHIGSSLNGIIT